MHISSVGGVLCVLLLHLCFLSVIGLYFLENWLSFQNFDVLVFCSRSKSVRTLLCRPDASLSTGSSSLFDRSDGFVDRSKSPKIVPVGIPRIPFGRPVFRPDGRPDKKKKKKFRKSKKSHCFVCVLGTFYYYDENWFYTWL